MAQQHDNFIKRYWRMLKSPASTALWVVLGFGFVSGVIFWGGFNTGLELTNTEAFCISCHEMEDNVYKEYQETIHYSNRSGVRATCPDCHVPKDWTHKIVRKVAATKELWGYVTGLINTREKFQFHRKELALREWQRMKESDSRECRNCHDYDSMDFSEQGRRALRKHSLALESGDKTCIDCHKGIAHELPDMEGVEGWH